MEKLLYELRKLSAMDPVVSPVREANLARWAGKTQPVASDQAPSEIEEPKAPVSFKTFDERRTRRADLPANLQKVYDGIAEDYKLRRGLHEKMKMATTNEDRARFRARIIETDGRIRGAFTEIDAFLAKQAEEQEKAKAGEFKESTARSYISKALKKDKLSASQQATIKARYEALLAHGCTVDDKTIKALKSRKLI